MAKRKKKVVKKKTATKRKVTCGKCKQTGHNARTCKTNVETPEPPAPVIEVPKPEKKINLPPPPEPAEERRMRVPKRPAPTAGIASVNNFAPYRCPKCSQVAILVAVRVKDHYASQKKERTIYKAETRCEKCFNKPPAELILKWGMRPGEQVEVRQDA